MPCDDSEMFSSILGSISDYIVNKDDSVSHYIVLGDFNCSYLIPSQSYEAFIPLLLCVNLEMFFIVRCLVILLLIGITH